MNVIFSLKSYLDQNILFEWSGNPMLRLSNVGA